MATAKQKEAARRNIKKAQKANTGTSRGSAAKRSTPIADAKFAFPKERKEPLTDARHVRNAIARFDQVEGVTDAERSRAWKRIKAAAEKFDVEVTADDWRDLFERGKAKKPS
jgi:hypothetical protein